MNKKVIEKLEKILSDENLQEEISDSDQDTDKLFKLCQDYLCQDFTREEFDFALSEIFVSFFESLKNFPDISESELKNVVGGLNSKKITSVSLATLSLMGSVPNFSPKAEANGFISGVGKIFGGMELQDKLFLETSFILMIPGIYKFFK